MTTNQNDIVARVYASLTAIYNNLDKLRLDSVSETYVIDYHFLLDRLEKIGFDVAEFRVDTSVLRPQLEGRTGDQDLYSKEKYVGRTLLLIKMESVLRYFEITTAEPKRTIGFKHK